MFRILLQNQHPLVKIMMLFFLLLMMTALGFSIATMIVSGQFGLDFQEAGKLMTEADTPEGRSALRWSNTLFQLLGFLGSAIIFRLIYGEESVAGFRMKYLPTIAFLAPVLMVSSAPLIEGSLLLNDLLIPDGSALAEWGGPMQEQADETTEAILGDSSEPIWIHLILMAFIPALCEEFFFRGVLQVQLAKTTRNIHAGIWITAFLFAATHMQIFGFLPRLVIGALLGYLVIWTGSIWSAVIAHFANNAIALWAMRVMMENEGIDPVAEAVWQPGPLIFYSLVFIGLTYVLIRFSRWPSFKEGYLLFRKKDVDAFLAEKYDRPPEI